MTHQYSSTESAGSIEEKTSRDSLLAGGARLLIDEELCLNLRGRTLSCEACANQCTFGALELSEDTIALNTDNCTACGACVSFCPTGAFRLPGFSPLHFLHGLESDHEAHIHCSVSAGKDEDISLPCLHLLDARLIAAAFAAGTETFHLAGLGHCEQCIKGNAINQMMATQNKLMQWFGAESTPRMLVASIPLTAWVKDRHRPEEQAQMSRRQFFRRAGLRAMASASHYSTPTVNNDDTSLDSEIFHPVSTQHQRAVEYQSLLAACVSVLPWQPNKIPWHGRSINNDACNACLVCGQRCPTGALQAEQSDAGRGISFEASLCTDCGLCAQVCPMAAIERSTINDAAEITAARSLLMYRHHRACPHCAQDFLPQKEDEALCPACKNEQALESEWLTQCAH